MTVTDVKVQETQVLSVPQDTAVERAWATEMLESLRLEEQKAMAAWKLWAHLRDDGRMTKVAEDLTRVRAMIAYLARIVET